MSCHFRDTEWILWHDIDGRRSRPCISSFQKSLSGLPIHVTQSIRGFCLFLMVTPSGQTAEQSPGQHTISWEYIMSDHRIKFREFFYEKRLVGLFRLSLVIKPKSVPRAKSSSIIVTSNPVSSARQVLFLIPLFIN